MPMRIFTFNYNVFFSIVCLLLLSNNVFADYTVTAEGPVNASALTGESGVLTINGRLVINSNQTLSGFTTVIINGPDGNIYWENNSDLAFPNVTIFQIKSLSNPNLSGGLQPTAGNGNGAQRLYIGDVLIAVSSDNASNGIYSFEDFNKELGLPIVTGNLDICVGSTTTLIASGTPASSNAWTSSNTGIAIVDNSGKVSGIAPGTSTITFTNKFGTKAKVIITVSAPYYWTGRGKNNLWSNPDNWTVCGVPPEKANVTIVDTSNDPLVDIDVIVGNLMLGSGATIELNTNTKLTLGTSVSSVINNMGVFKAHENGTLIINGTLSLPLCFDPSRNKLGDLEINTSSKKVTLGSQLQIKGVVNVKSGTLESTNNTLLTLISTKDSYAQIAKLEGSADVTGYVNVQTFFTGKLNSSYRGDRMVSFPVQDDLTENIFRQLQKDIVVTGPGGPANGFDSGGGNPNAVTLSTYEEPQNALKSFQAVPTINTRAEKGRAVFVFFRGNRDNATGNKVNSPYAVPEDVTGNYRGSINKGTINVSITNTNASTDLNHGMNAVGNPYPAAIDWERVYDSNKSIIGNEIRINKAGGGFITRSDLGVVPIEYTEKSRFIQPGQGFFVKMISTGTTAQITFLESHKDVIGSAARLLSVPSTDRLSSHPEHSQQIRDFKQKNKALRINIQQNELKDETLVVFQDGFNSSFDNNDAIYFAGNAVLVGSLTSDGQVTSINAMPDVKDVNELRLYVNATASGTAKLNFTDISAGDGYQIFLKDALSPDKLIDLKQQSTYEFTIDRANASTYGLNRFTVVFKPELIEAPIVFTAQIVKSNVELNWTSQVAPKVSYFEVEVSTDKVSFQNLGLVANAGTGADVKYSFVDKSPSTSIRFYRLKQFNINGSITYSEPKMIDLSASGLGIINSVNVYPNPASERIEVVLSEKPQSELQVTIFNAQGKKIKKSTFLIGETIGFEVGQFPQGIYLLELRSSSDRKIIGHSKFIVGP